MLLRLVVNKKAGPIKSLSIAVVSDIHFSRVITIGRLEKIVNAINSLNPDIILIPGDIVDSVIGPMKEQNAGELLRRLRSRYGTFASTGNHEFYGDLEETIAYLEKHGITFVREKAVKINDSFYLVGRDDQTAESYLGIKRKSISDLLAEVEKRLPIILLDHRPSLLDEARDNGIDLQLSGHTHNGQIFPINLITKAVYEKSWGYARKDTTHYYISCGAGSWGPPIRLGSVSEVVHITLDFIQR